MFAIGKLGLSWTDSSKLGKLNKHWKCQRISTKGRITLGNVFFMGENVMWHWPIGSSARIFGYFKTQVYRQVLKWVVVA